MFSKISGKGRQLVYCDCDINEGEPVFLDIGDQEPVSLFGAHCHAAAISDKGDVIFINRESVGNSPDSHIAAVSLPDGEKASSVAFMEDLVVVLSSNGRVFSSSIEKGSCELKFSSVSELGGEEIVCISSNGKHCLAVSKEGRAFGLGSNECGRLGLDEATESVSSFTEISSLGGHKIIAAYAGSTHSLFQTRKGQILSCGSNGYGQLLLSCGPSKEKVYSPRETTITGGSTFCIAGNGLSAVFISHVRYCQNYNRRNGITFKVSPNKFSCHTPSEYKSILGVPGFKNTIAQKNLKKNKITTVPDSCDWRDKGLVNPIKDQGSCGSCWAFSAVAASESAYSFTTGKLLQFSEQNFVDCANCYGCSGGWADSALYYAISDQNGQFNSENDYPYTATDGSCSYDSSKAIGKITRLISVEWRDENDLKEKIANYGVASVSISAGNSPFMSYSGGILDDDECQPLSNVDHAVAAVGYGSENGIDYWIVRNSWGTSWGEEGYVRMIRNKDNQCQIASQAFVVVDEE